MLNFINKEIDCFKKLSIQSQQLVISYFFYSLAYPILTTFSNAYIWRNNNQIIYLLYYRLGHFFMTPFAYLINGFFLRKYKINWLYLLGSLLLAISVILMIFFHNRSIISYVIIGLIFGLGTGFFWANRNYLISKSTTDKDRNYFYGLNFSINIFSYLMVSFFVGWLIVYGLSYAFLMMLVFFILLFSGLVILRVNYSSPKIKKIFISKITYFWLTRRLIVLGIGFVEGLNFFIPSILILKYLGNEGILGTLTAIASLISALAIYIFGRKSNSSNNKYFFIVTMCVGFILSSLLAYFFNKVVLLIYVLSNNLITIFLWSTFAPVLLNSIDYEIVKQENIRYSYLVDSELFLNSGRFLSALVCLLLIFFTNEYFALRFTPIFLYVSALSIFIPLNLIKKH